MFVSEADPISRANAAYLEQMYEQYLLDPSSVDQAWARYFTGLDAPSGNGAHSSPVGHTLTRITTHPERNIGVFDLIHSYRGFGHLVARLDPLGNNPEYHPYLDPVEFGFDAGDLERIVECPTFKNCNQARLRDLVQLLRQTYCGSLGVEYMEIFDKEKRSWLQERMEPDLNRPRLSADDRRFILQRLTAAESFEQYLHTKFVGQKRFSLEGGESLIPLLDFLIEDGAGTGVEEVVLGMAHRGRLNVLAHVLDKPYHLIFSEFEGAFLPADIQGDGDVKYHLGYSHNHVTRSGRSVHLSLSSNPSHLEAVNPVVQGIVRAKQNRLGDPERARVIPILIHGDASFTGQGVVSETLALSELEAYRTGGTIHIIINNQIGFTTSPRDYRFTRYPSDTAKEIQAPVFHVNGDDPEAAVQAAKLAIAYRQRFKADVIIDLVCYRRHGHNEADDPTYTQPVLYEKIRNHPTTRAQYEDRLRASGDVGDADIEAHRTALRQKFDEELNYARDYLPRQRVQALGGWWKDMHWAGADWSADTKVPLATLERIMAGVLSLPQGFAVHPKIRKLLDDRARMIQPGGKLDWACAEMLALGTLLLEGRRVRLAGQDSGRGTFSHRHAALTDVHSNQRHVPLDHLSPDQGRFILIDSMLSEVAVLGFEYGFSTADPHNLVMWEAQFGDFANGAQVVIDQFIASGESKWQRMSGLVLLLPHGYEGQGPEHSSARLERYLQLCAENNLQVCNLTTPAQYFHAIRRQVHREFRKPLILMAPKSLLRNKLCVSDVTELTGGTFQPVLDDIVPLDRDKVRRILFCTGKIFYELLAARSERDISDVALVRVEQLYPFPATELDAIFAAYPNAGEAFWVQEEPANMGAWTDVERRFRDVLPERIPRLAYAGRRAAASPATGNYKLHVREGEALIDAALRKPYGR
jgi:2-oxoglutarate dehydrogenase E1 component